MIFKEDLAKKVVAGEKTATRRVMKDNPRSHWYRRGCIYKVGQVFTINPGRGVARIAEARVTKVFEQAPIDITDEQARMEGFSTAEEFLDGFPKINPGVDLTEPVWVVEFELVEVHGG